ncbi:MAG: rhomboid family intramembrane serine protease [Planctomycetota bacterium]
MTIILIVVTVVIFFIDMLTSQQTKAGLDSWMINWFGCFKSTLVEPWKYFQFLTYGFLHAQDSLMHVGFNMLGLFIFGRAVEERLGRDEFLKFYLISMTAGGLVGCLTYWVMGVPAGVVIGASGAVLATVILFVCFNPNVTLLLMFVYPVKAWVIAVVYVGADLLGAISMLTREAAAESGGGTAFTVHLAGIGFALLYFYRGWNFRWIRFGNYSQSMKRSIRRSKLKIHDPDAKLRKESEEVDRILAKIHATGEQSLTRAERRALEAHSRRQREKRNRS